MTILFIGMFLLGGLFLDTAILPQLAILGLVPDVLVCITISFALLYGSTIGASVGVAGGLMLDVMCGPALGFYGLIYLLLGLGAGLMDQRRVNKYLLPSVAAVLAVIAKAAFHIVYLALQGYGEGSFAVFLRYILPGALLSGLIMVPLHLLIRTRKIFKSLKRSKMQNYYE
ncbi:MAG: rod shape-determining protein MreD [Christensenellales bacterium]